MTKPRLTGSRFAYKLFEICQVPTEILAPENLRKTPRFSDASALLPGSVQNIENDVTYSKQRTGEFLPGATTTNPHSGYWKLSRDPHFESRTPSRDAGLNAPRQERSLIPTGDYLKFALRGSKFDSTVQPICSHNVVNMPSALNSFQKLLEMCDNGETEFESYLARTISDLNCTISNSN